MTLWRITARDRHNGTTRTFRMSASDHTDAIRRCAQQGLLVRRCVIVENDAAMRAKAQAAAFLLSIKIAI